MIYKKLLSPPGLQGAPYEPDDIYVTNKLNAMRPDPQELTYPSMVVSHIEAALKCCSDWLHEEEISEEYTSALANKRTLLGMQRVGPIAMDMMLTGERRAHVVLTCGRRPTRQLLEQVAGKTIEMLQYTSRGFLNYQQMQKDFDEYHKNLDEAETQAKQEEEMEKQAQEAAKKLKVENEDNDKKIAEGGDDDNKEGADDKFEESKEGETGDGEEVEKDKIVGNDDKFKNAWSKQNKPKRPNPEYYTIGIEHSNSGFVINYGVVTARKMNVRVTLTSSLIRDDLMLAKKEEKEKERKASEGPDAKRRKKDKVKVKKEAKDPNEKKPDDKVENKDEKEGEPTVVGETPAEEPEENKEEPSAPEPETLTNMSGWATMTPMMPSEEDKTNFKYGPYASTMTLEDCEIMEKEGGPLPTQPGLGALAELRRIKWFQHIGLNTPYLPDICRLIRGLAIRESHWKSFRILCPWTIALILENIIRYEVKTHQNTALTLSPARVLKLCLETISKGFRFPKEKEKKDKPKEEVKEEASEIDKFISEAKSSSVMSHRREDEEKERSSRRYTHKLIDPCEANEDYDALTHIPSARKSDIRACAKLSLDLIGREQIWMLLNTPEIEGLNMGGGEHEVTGDEREKMRRREHWYNNHGKYGNAVTNQGGFYSRTPNSSPYQAFGSYSGEKTIPQSSSHSSYSGRDSSRSSSSSYHESRSRDSYDDRRGGGGHGGGSYYGNGRDSYSRGSDRDRNYSGSGGGGYGHDRGYNRGHSDSYRRERY